ncbi:oxidoreductase-like domain-containing protein 1 [Anopheles darlingi]|uniref:oxidoreductase-like domain-containing protein 1 n=1 Tax=Anopheles darlingi TaxID=43151 RepID=UPI002100169F|nr:oxidoreductase-like domain-containing protein 1 [Anopheles darlingi]XP_049540878.1 oxidoreductase-like domain-containing protein 1 [Anopheles darlingi]
MNCAKGFYGNRLLIRHCARFTPKFFGPNNSVIDNSVNGKGEPTKTTDSIPELPPEPTTCCMSGCQNCVWIQYAAELTKILDDGGEKAREIVLQRIEDPSLKMFLRMELQNMPPSKPSDSS